MAPVREEVHGAGTTGMADATRPSLREWFTAYTRSPRGPAVLPPCRDNASGALRSASAPGCQDHTISPSVTAPFVRARNTRCGASRPSHPALNAR